LISAKMILVETQYSLKPELKSEVSWSVQCISTFYFAIMTLGHCPQIDGHPHRTRMYQAYAVNGFGREGPLIFIN
jgi:hypothetical protein